MEISALLRLCFFLEFHATSLLRLQLLPLRHFHLPNLTSKKYAGVQAEIGILPRIQAMQK